MRQVIEKVFFALLRFEISKTELCDEQKNLITPEILPALYKLSKKHDLAHLICDALDKNGLLFDGETKKRFLNERFMAVCRYERQQYEFEKICEVLEKAKITYVPLKGSVIRKYYPEPWMRTSCDIDILVGEKELSSAVILLQKELEYNIENFESTHDVSLFSSSGVHLELHHSLAESNRKNRANDVLLTVWDNLETCEGYKKSLSNEMLYFYHIAHMAKHFEDGGCGVRPFLDILLLKKQENYKTEKCAKLLEQGCLLVFSQAMEETANAWFNGVEETPIVDEIKQYVLYAGMYADVENRVAIKQMKQGGKAKYYCSRLFLSYDDLLLQYPKLHNRKWLIPFYQIKRWFRLLFGKDSNTVSKEIKASGRVTNIKREKVKKLFKELGL